MWLVIHGSIMHRFDLKLSLIGMGFAPENHLSRRQFPCNFDVKSWCKRFDWIFPFVQSEGIKGLDPQSEEQVSITSV